MTRPGSYRRAADSVRIADEVARVCDLRALGLSFRKIATAMDCDVHEVHRRWREGLQMRVLPHVEEAVKASLERLDLLDERLVAGLQSNDLPVRLKAIDSARRIDESRRILLGCN